MNMEKLYENTLALHKHVNRALSSKDDKDRFRKELMAAGEIAEAISYNTEMILKWGEDK